jgi:hypothetical protein
MKKGGLLFGGEKDGSMVSDQDLEKKNKGL